MGARARGGSLTQRLLIVLISSLTVVALILGIGGVWFSRGVAEQTADRVLKASARAIAETLAVEDGEITLDLPPAALGMLEDDARDNIYYNIRHNRTLVTGYPDFPFPSSAVVLTPESTYFRYETYRDVKVRVATEVRHLPRINGLVIVQVAETLTERNALESRMLVALAVLEAIFVGVAGLLVWPAVAWSLRPVTRLRRQLDARSSADFTPINQRLVPAELGQLVLAFNALLNRLESAVGGMRRFTADASHQMRTPLAVLRAHVAVLRQQGTETPEGKASLHDIDAAVDRLRRLISQLIALARAEEGVAGAAQGQRFDLTALAAESARQLAPAALDHGVEIHFEHPEATIKAFGTPLFVEEMLRNLIENAIRYNVSGGVVTVRVASPDGVPILEVEDDGPGIPEKDYDQVFQRFHRLSRDREHVGSGLGLPIVKTLATAMHAALGLASGADGRGLKVTLTFPTKGGASSAPKPSAKP